MANDLNACHFTGRLGQDPEVRHLPSGNMVANLRLAVGKQWRDKQSGAKQEATSWFTCVAFAKTAELAQQYLNKGDQVRLTCEAQERKWQDQQGNNRSTIEFVVREMQFLGGSRQQGGQQQGGHQQPPQQGYGQQPPQGQPPQGQAPQGVQQQPPPQGSQQRGAPDPGSFDDFADDIPF